MLPRSLVGCGQRCAAGVRLAIADHVRERRPGHLLNGADARGSVPTRPTQRCRRQARDAILRRIGSPPSMGRIVYSPSGMSRGASAVRPIARRSGPLTL